MHYDVVIVGGGHGGAQAAIALRQNKFAGSIAIVGDEPDFPYERPPLTKEFMSGEKTFDRILIRTARFWNERSVEMLLGRRVTNVDAEAHTVTTADGQIIKYGVLIWAAGGSPRKLTCSGHDLTGVHTVRTRIDAEEMMARLPHVHRAVVIGGGYIGLEAAAVLAKSGKHVTILEAADRVLARVAGESLSRFYETEHRTHGVDVRVNVMVSCIEEREGKASGVRLADGELVPADMVVVGIGIEPAVRPLIDAGAAGGNGVRVSPRCETSLKDVFAIGDCALHVNRFAGNAEMRLESVQNANDQAVVVAKTIVGEHVEYNTVPWFWSNQYDLKLQTIGLSYGHDQVVVRGIPSSRSFSVVYLKAGHVIALDCVNTTRDYVQGRLLLSNINRVPIDRLRDSSVSLKSLVENG